MSSILPHATTEKQDHHGGEEMDDETFNLSMRKFLKKVGVTSQQKIEEAVRAAHAEGRLAKGALPVKVTLEIAPLGLSHEVEGEIRTEGEA